MPLYSVFVELEGMGPNGEKELYEIKQPSISVHNLVFGANMYLDIGGESTIVNHSRPGYVAKLTYQKRGWYESSYFVVNGEVKNGDATKFKIEGKWNGSIEIINTIDVK